MGKLSTKNSHTHSSHGTRIQPENLKLESNKIVEIMGEMDEWQKWKYRTECTSGVSGYDWVLTDATYSGQNTQINLVVYYHLEVATVEGTAHHLVKQHEDYKNGYAGWNAL